MRTEENLPTFLQEAVVIGGGNNNWIIQSDTGTCNAKKSVSCLVCPEIGDIVLIVSMASGGSNILAILERKQSHTTHLKFDNNVNISSTQSIRLFANERIDAVSGDKMSFDSKQLSFHSKIVSMIFDKMNVTGNEAVHAISKIQVMAKYIETVSETSKQAMKNSFRLISGLDSTKAGEMLQMVKNRFTVQSKQATILADEDAKLNAKRVHLG